MLHIDDKRVKRLLLQGNFGLEKESLRVLRNGSFSHTPHPFPLSETHIVRDFCENQTEINTSVYDSPDGAVDALLRYTRKVNETAKTTCRRRPLPAFFPPKRVIANICPDGTESTKWRCAEFT